MSPARVRSLEGVRLLHHLADSGQGFPANSQRGAIAQAIDAKTRLAFRMPQARINKTGKQPCPRQDEQHRTPNKADASDGLIKTS
jgi:hypothetical protein